MGDAADHLTETMLTKPSPPPNKKIKQGVPPKIEYPDFGPSLFWPIIFTVATIIVIMIEVMTLNGRPSP